MVVDEFQRVPDLISAIQVEVDARPGPGQFILTGSRSFVMMEQISQSLAGRISLQILLPLSLSEVLSSGGDDLSLWEPVHGGFYPASIQLPSIRAGSTRITS